MAEAVSEPWCPVPAPEPDPGTVIEPRCRLCGFRLASIPRCVECGMSQDDPRW